MVAIVTGNQLGLAGSSGSVLGTAGQLGNAALGQAKEAAYVNAKTSNLTIQRQDILVDLATPVMPFVLLCNKTPGIFFFLKC